MYTGSVVHNLTLVHALLALAAAATVFFVVQELREASVSQWWLFAPGAAALFAATGLLFIQLGAGQGRWPFVVAAAAGLAIGGVRGLTIGLQHDPYQPNVIISRAGRISFLCVGLGVAACVAADIVGAFLSPALEKLRFWVAWSALVCAVAMLARAAVLAIRLHRQT